MDLHAMIVALAVVAMPAGEDPYAALLHDVTSHVRLFGQGCNWVSIPYSSQSSDMRMMAS